MLDIKEQISQDLYLPKHFVDIALNRANKKCFPIKIPKKGGGFRSVIHPPIELKLVQYWLIKNIFGFLKIHSSASAYVKGSSVVKNASVHSQGVFFLKLDFEHFFESINYEVFEPYLQPVLRNLDADLESGQRLILKACFGRKTQLLIGYPTSPVISNAVMYRFDETVLGFLEKNESTFGTVHYTRYADDMFFSSTKNNLKLVYEYVKSLIETSDSQFPFLKLKDSKTKFYSKGRGNAHVTGLRFCYDGHITLHRKYKDHVRLLFSMKSKGFTILETDAELKGHLSYIRAADPAFYTRIVKKYLTLINQLKPY